MDSTKMDIITEPPNATSTPAIKPRKNKKSNKSKKSTNDEINQINNSTKDSNCTELQESPISILQKSLKLKKLKAAKVNGRSQNTSSTFNIEDLSDSEDIWIMNLPKSVNPQTLRGQTLTLNNKSKFKVKDEQYSVTIHNANPVTCVLTTGKMQHKIVSIKPTGLLTLKKKLEISSEEQLAAMDYSSVRFANLMWRHPLLCNDEKYKKRLQKLGLKLKFKN